MEMSLDLHSKNSIIVFMKTIIFDMDGVVTSEEGYWRAAFSSILDLAAFFGHEGSKAALFSSDYNEVPWSLSLNRQVIGSVKRFRINTCWDLCHVAAIGLLQELCLFDHENISRILSVDWSAPLTSVISCSWPEGYLINQNRLLQSVVSQKNDTMGFELMDHFAGLVPELKPLLVRSGVIWEWLYFRFQDWFNGSEGLYPKQGIVHGEQLVVDPILLCSVLASLQADGWRLTIATGRPRGELLPTLERSEVLSYFDSRAIVTHDDVVKAQDDLKPISPLGKPHPFQFLKALYPSHSDFSLISCQTGFAKRPQVIVVGDTSSDISAGVAIGAITVGVLSGASGPDGEAGLRKEGADHIIADVTLLPSIL